MDIHTESIKKTDTIFEKSNKLMFLIGTIMFCVILIIDFLNYKKQSFNFLASFNVYCFIAMAIMFFLYLKKWLTLKKSSGVLVYIVLLNLCLTNFFNYYYTELYVYEFLLSTAFSILLISVAGFCLNSIHVYITGFFYLITFYVFVFLTGDTFLLSKILILSLLIIGYTFGVGFYFSLLEKANKKEIESINNLLKEKRLNYQKEMKTIDEKILNMNISIDVKNKELIKRSMQMLQFTENNSNLICQLNKLKGKVKPSELRKLNDIIQEYKIRNKTLYWEDFEMYFDCVHVNFSKNLHEIYPNITPAERKLAVFLRLGMSTKQIATMIVSTPESVDVARSRLRKKIKADKHDNLKNIFLEI